MRFTNFHRIYRQNNKNITNKHLLLHFAKSLSIYQTMKKTERFIPNRSDYVGMQSDSFINMSNPLYS